MTTEIYSVDEMKVIEKHISKHYGKFKDVYHEIVSPDIHIDICIVPATEEKNYYTLVTMGMGAHKMNVPSELKEDNLERAEIAISLPYDWKVGESDETWYWPIRLLKSLARLPKETDSWIGWGHTVDNGEVFAENTNLCASVIVEPQGVDGEAEICVLPNGEKVNFYHVIPLYEEELEYKKENDCEQLLAQMADVSFVVDPQRFNAISEELEEELYAQIMDDAEWHLENIRDKNLNASEISAYNHMAIYLRWCIENDLMSDVFLEKEAEIVNKVKTDPINADLRSYIKEKLGNLLILPYFNDEGIDFARYYYSYASVPYFPSDVDNYALNYFGEERYYCDEFDDETYLFIPFDENYYQEIAKIIKQRYDAWKINKEDNIEDNEPLELVQAMMEYLDCNCEYFPPMKDDDPITAAYSYAKRNGKKDGFIPVLINVDQTFWDCLIDNSDSVSENDEYAFNPQKVAEYRKQILEQPVGNGYDIIHNLLDGRKKEAIEDGIDWQDEIIGEMSDGEANDRFISYWDYDTEKTAPTILAYIPVNNPWEVFAYLPFGGWNDCPNTEELMAISKYWFEKYGAVPAAISKDSLEYVLPKEIEKEKAIEVSQEHYACCPDVLQNFEELGILADCLYKSKMWYFWWD